MTRVGPNELHFNCLEAWDDIYGQKPGRPVFQKDPMHIIAMEPIPGAANLTVADDVTHIRQRRALAYAFSQKALVEQESILQFYVIKFIEKVTMFGSKGFNIIDWFNFTTFNNIGDLTFGEPFGCLDDGRTSTKQLSNYCWLTWALKLDEDGTSRQWVDLVYESIRAGAFEQASRRVATNGTFLQRFLMTFIPTTIQEQRRQHLTSSAAKTARRLSAKSDHRDFLWYIVKQRAKKHEVSDNEIIVNAAMFM